VNQETGTSQTPPVTLGLLDDHEVFRLGLRTLLSRTAGMEVVWAFGSAREALEQVRSSEVDVVLIDINLGGTMDGLSAARLISREHPKVKVILITALADGAGHSDWLAGNVAAVLSKDLPASELIAAIESVVAERRQARRFEGRQPGRRPVALSRRDALSVREVEVLAAISRGLTNREIGFLLGIATSTVNKHVHQVLRKLGVRNRAQAASFGRSATGPGAG